MKLNIDKYKEKFRDLSQKLSLNLKGKLPYIQDYIIYHKQSIFKIALPFMIIGVGFYACSASHRAIRKNITDIFNISDQIRLSYVGKPDYWGLSTENIIKDNLVSDEYIKDGKLVLSSGVNVLVGLGKEASMIMPRTNYFDIVLGNLNKAECISYAEMALDKDSQTKLVRISVSNRSGTYLFEWGGVNSLPVKKYTSREFCADNDNVLIWTVQ